MEKVAKSVVKSVVLSMSLLLACNESNKISPDSEAKTIINPTEISTEGISIGSYSTSSIPNGKTEEGVAKFLIFKDQKTFEKVLHELNGKPYKDMDNWEKELGFVSLRKLFQDAVAEELKLRIKEEFLSKEQQERIIKYAYVTDLVANSLDFIIPNHETGYEMKIYNSYMARLVNRNGIVQIGKEIQKHDKEVIKIIKDGDLSKLSLLDDIKETDVSKGIEVIKVNANSKPIGNGRAEGVFSNKSCESVSGYPGETKKQGFDTYYETYSGANQKYENYIEVKFYTRGFLGFWYPQEGDLNAQGTRTYWYSFTTSETRNTGLLHHQPYLNWSYVWLVRREEFAGTGILSVTSQTSYMWGSCTTN